MIRVPFAVSWPAGFELKRRKLEAVIKTLKI